MATYKARVDRDLCIGAATCVAIAPKAFAMDSQAKAIVLPTIDEEDDTKILDAAKGCPVAAIFVTEKDGKQIFP